MPARTQQTSRELRHARASRETIARGADRIEETGRATLNANAARVRSERRRVAALRREQHVRRQHPGLTAWVITLFVLLLFPLIPFVDYALASGTTEFIVATSFPTLDQDAITVRKIGVCLGIFGLELLIALMLSITRDQGGREARYWAAAGLLVASVMAGMSIMVASASQTMQQLTGPAAAIPVLIGLVAFLFHAVTVFGGDHIRFAFEFAFLALVATFFFAMRALAEARARRNIAALERADRLYGHAREEHESTYRIIIPRTRFAADIEQLLAMIKGREIPAPELAPAPAAGNPAAHQTPPSDEQPIFADLFAEDEARRAETEVTA